MRPFIENYPYGSNRAALAPLSSDTVNAVVLAAGVSETFAIPAGAKFFNMSFTGDVWVNFGTNSGVTAAVPSADVTNGSASVLNPARRRIPDGVTHVAFISEVANKGSIEYWGL